MNWLLAAKKVDRPTSLFPVRDYSSAQTRALECDAPVILIALARSRVVLWRYE